MEFGNAFRPAVAGIHIVSARPDAAVSGAVPVELPPEQTVQSASAGEPVIIDIRQRQAAGSGAEPQREGPPEPEDDGAAERRLSIDPETRSVVLQTRDPDTGETVVTVPDEALLKLRQYSRALVEQSLEDADTARFIERTA